ncbi:MAG: alpha/beta fold hydrolase [Alphaproteobacteria bacterium]|nr:alpha/beta fold hydrolase [Alphaproteobacteria bacterium]NCQ67590.1 alpha/beta fold hydrolase [Alphaproteobacteria bacterium]NCT08362.1 alpha/beta fold hydrolase [Alphaproteobacteria bacterium]
MFLRFILILLGLMLYFVNAYASIGTQEISFISKSSRRILVAEVYYPTSCKVEKKKIPHGIWMRENYSKGQPCVNGKRKYPLVVFSHGFRGDRFGNSWIAEALVSKGYIVVMIDHTFNTSYEHSDLFLYTSMWQRPVDISELLTYLLESSQWGKIINKEKIAVAGFSLGGTTALWVGGIKADKDKFKQALDDKYSRWSDWPKYASENARAVDWNKAEHSYKDDRIKAVISIAPDLGEAFTAEGLKEMSVPTLIIVGDKDRITPKKQNAEFYSKSINRSELLVIEDADHFTFMNKCSSIGFKIAPYLSSSDDKKASAHTLVIDRICDFLQGNLK